MTTASKFLENIESEWRRREIQDDFFGYDPSDHINNTEIHPKVDKHSWIGTKLVYTLYLRSETRSYHKDFPPLDRKTFVKRNEIPTYCRSRNLEASPIRRVLNKGRKLDFCEATLEEPGIPLVFSPISPSLDKIPESVIEESCRLLLGGEYPFILELARKLSPWMDPLQETYDDHVAQINQQFGGSQMSAGNA